MSPTPLPCVILGATGTVGQRFIQLIASHPSFIVAAVAASDRSAGQTYEQACKQWKLNTPIPESIKTLIVTPCSVSAVQHSAPSVRVVFSALDSSVAGEIEEEFALAGYRVFSNARNHRMDTDVPILIPHVNADHIDIVKQQQKNRGYDKGGFIVTNANCSSTGLVVVLKPILQQFGIEQIHVVTMQAISGAGYPGVSSLDILDNLIPYISGEEPKMEIEPKKILGLLSEDGSSIQMHHMKISATCNRVPVIDGHTECCSIKLSKPATVEQIIQCLQNYTSTAQQLQLPSAPQHCIYVHTNDDTRPQPRLDRDLGNGMTVSVGRIRQCPLFDIKLTFCSHNTIIGAAGGSIQNAELAYKKGLL